MNDKIKKTPSKLKLVPTKENLDNIQKSFDRARIKIKKEENLKKEDFKSV